MAQSETILLVMADAARRTACFAQLADRPQRIVRGFSNASDAIEALEEGAAGCLIIDRVGIDGAALVPLLHRVADYPAVIPLVLANRLEPDEILALVHAGPCEILPEAVAADHLADRVAAAIATARQRGAEWRDRCAARAALARLSPRETEVLNALANGQTSKDIARSLGVSPRTIEVHRASIMRRTGTTTLAAVLRLCFLAERSDAAISSKAA